MNLPKTPGIPEFIKEANEHNFPYQIVLCKECDLSIVGDCETWPPRGMKSCYTCEETWCRECSKTTKLPLCEVCSGHHCETCKHYDY